MIIALGMPAWAPPLGHQHTFGASIPPCKAAVREVPCQHSLWEHRPLHNVANFSLHLTDDGWHHRGGR